MIFIVKLIETSELCPKSDYNIRANDIIGSTIKDMTYFRGRILKRQGDKLFVSGSVRYPLMIADVRNGKATVKTSSFELVCKTSSHDRGSILRRL